MSTSENNRLHYYFFIGTEAELIKVFPILLALKKSDIPYKIIASGQNKIWKSSLIEKFNLTSPSILLSDKVIKQNFLGLLFWFLTTFIKGYLILKNEFKDKKVVLIVHGDTISTVMGAYLGKILKSKVAHVEAGLRSFDLLHPFPEEIDRLLVSKVADINYCPNKWSKDNIKNTKCEKINTYQNTLLDSLEYALKVNDEVKFLKSIKKEKFFIFVLHRQENLMKKNFVKKVITEVSSISKNIKCLFVTHPSTKKVLHNTGIFKKLKKNPNILLSNRIEYTKFMKILNKSEFIITDGGSNQEESYYFGKPCFLLRKRTERLEGIDANVILCYNSLKNLKSQTNNYKKLQKKKIITSRSPSQIVANHLKKI